MKISHFLQAGQTLKTDTFKENPYLMLPAIYDGILTKEEKKCAYIKGKHNV